MEKSKLASIFQLPVVQIGIVLVLVLLNYFGIWSAYFSGMDDFVIIGWVRHQPTFFEAMKGYGTGVRYLLYLTIWLKLQLFDLNPAPYYWISLIQHMVVTCIVYWLVDFWTKRGTVAFLSALIFGTSLAHFTVVTIISTSSYSLRAIPYLLTLGFFALYLKHRWRSAFLAAVGAYVFVASSGNYSLSIPLLLIAYHLTLGLGGRPLRSFQWQDVLLHVPFWILWSVNVFFEFGYIISGSSEVVYSDQSYHLGPHIVSNLYYLVHLIIPNIQIPAINHYLLGNIGAPLLVLITWITLGVAIVGHGIAVFALWKGSSLVRFGILLSYIPFLQYTLWQGDFAGAPRYLYLSSTGFALLLSLTLIWIHDQSQQRNKLIGKMIVAVTVIPLILVNLIANQIWVRQHVENGKFRHAFVTQLATEFKDTPPGSKILIEVPTDKYLDLSGVCLFILDPMVQCKAYVAGEPQPIFDDDAASDQPVYLLQANSDGFLVEVLPATVSHKN